jgi:hypothetical protein
MARHERSTPASQSTGTLVRIARNETRKNTAIREAGATPSFCMGSSTISITPGGKSEMTIRKYRYRYLTIWRYSHFHSGDTFVLS